MENHLFLRIKKSLIFLDLLLRNAYVLHFLMCFFITAVATILIGVSVWTCFALPVFLGFGKESFDRIIKDGPFEVVKAIVTIIGGITFYLLLKLS